MRDAQLSFFPSPACGRGWRAAPGEGKKELILTKREFYMSTRIMLLSSALGLLILISAFFSGAETGMMAINRYRLRHLAKNGVKAAKRVVTLLARPDRLLGVVLIGNTFANIMSASIATLIAIDLWGEHAALAASVVLTFVVLIFAEVLPKTVAALYSQPFAFIVSRPLMFLLKLFYPIVWFVNTLVNALLRLVGVHVEKHSHDPLTSDELRSVVNEAKTLLPGKYSTMLLGILDLKRLTVEDIMVPRNALSGIDLDSDWQLIEKQITHSSHTRLPVYFQQLENIKGMLHIREALHLLAKNMFNRENIMRALEPAYFVPEGTPLYTQLINFQHEKKRRALVVDEYGDIQGLVTLEDILEEIVGEFSSDDVSAHDVQLQANHSYLVEGSVTIRQFNRVTGWALPTSGPKTLSGLVVDTLQTLPAVGTCMKIEGYPLEVVSVEDNRVDRVCVYPLVVSSLHE